MKIRDNKKALVTGITGQDGPYLAELLLEILKLQNNLYFS